MTIKIILTKENIKTNQILRDVTMIDDGLSITRFADKGDAQKVYVSLKQKGQMVELKNGLVVQRFKNKKAEEIVTMNVVQLKRMKKELRKKVNVNYEILR